MMQADQREHDIAEPGAQATILCVDDEPNIRSALKRLLRPKRYKVLLAQSGAEGLSVLEQEVVDLVISDMRMPEMDGAQFLSQVARRWPDAMRILLTGYADLTSTISAVNDGRIYRYISKPWEDNDICVAVQRALEHKALQQEHARLLALTQRQNEELKELNSNLEGKVKARTEEIRQTVSFLEMAYEQLNTTYRDTIPVFANLIELREGAAAGHGRRVAELSRQVGKVLGLDDQGREDLYYAGLLHDIGKIGLNDELIKTPYNDLSPVEREEMHQHAVTGQAALISLPSLQEAASLIRSHHERCDGEGYPDGLAGADIPLGARVLAVVNDYDALQNGSRLGEQVSRDEARAYVMQNQGTRYDPQVVKAFLAVLDQGQEDVHYVAELKLTSDDLRPGMVVARDFQLKEGTLLLAKGHGLTQALIDRIRAFERDLGRGCVIWVRTEQGGEHG